MVDLNVRLIPKELLINLFGPSTEKLGEGLGGLVNFVVGPLRRLDARSEKKTQDFISKINSKTDAIPLEHRDDSKLTLTLKVLEDARYSIDEEELRDMFAELTSATVDDRLNDSVHPKYSFILSNMSKMEADLLKRIYLESTSGVLPSLSISFLNSKGVQMDVAPRVLLFNRGLDPQDQHYETLQILSSDNLIEFGSSRLSNPILSGYYENYETTDLFEHYYETLEDIDLLDPKKDFDQLSQKDNYIQLTSFGAKLCHILFSQDRE